MSYGSYQQSCVLADIKVRIFAVWFIIRHPLIPVHCMQQEEAHPAPVSILLTFFIRVREHWFLLIFPVLKMVVHSAHGCVMCIRIKVSIKIAESNCRIASEFTKLVQLVLNFLPFEILQTDASTHPVYVSSPVQEITYRQREGLYWLPLTSTFLSSLSFRFNFLCSSALLTESETVRGYRLICHRESEQWTIAILH